MTGMLLWAGVVAAGWVWAVWDGRRDRQARSDREWARQHRIEP